jgi:hypothetical protein
MDTVSDSKLAIAMAQVVQVHSALPPRPLRGVDDRHNKYLIASHR